MKTKIPFCAMAALAGLSMALPPGVAARPLPFWQVATPVVEVNTPSPLNDGCPIESWDGLSLYIASNRPGTLGVPGPTGALPNDIWAADRASKDEPFGQPQHLSAPVNTDSNDFCPTPIYGSYLLFVSERPGEQTCGAGPGSGDIYMIRRNAADGWGLPQHLGCVDNGTGPNTAGAEFSPSLVKLNGATYLYFSSTVSGNMDIYRSRLGRDGRFGAPEPVLELNTEFDDRMPNVAADGREIVFSSNRPVLVNGTPVTSNFDVYVSTRASTRDPWSVPVNLGPNVNTLGNETRSTISRDLKRLYFGRDGDVYSAKRATPPRTQ